MSIIGYRNLSVIRSRKGNAVTLDPSTLVAGDELLTTDDYLMESVRLLRRLVDLNTPGVPGVRGAQEVPEIDIHRETISARRFVPGNRKRSVQVIRHSGDSDTLYVMDDADDPVTQGFPLSAGEALVHTARGPLWLEAPDGAIDVAFYEVSS